MYSRRSGLILGFHGCDEEIAFKVVNNKTSLRTSENEYDWLGHGVYFWENSPSRALEYATFLKNNPGRAKSPIKNPAVIGAVIQLGFCFDLVDFEMLQILKSGYDVFEIAWKNEGKSLPVNREVGNTGDLLLRELDCAVFETIHHIRTKSIMPPFDSVRSVFWEGASLYPSAGFKEKNHIQICIRNPNCIKGYFLAREHNHHYSKV